MKKILIVEDTQENMDAAKAFFSTIKDFEFVYATNRKEAEDLLESVDAVITDRQIPYVSGENVNSYAEDLLSEMKEDLSDDFDRYALKFLQQRQGYALMAIAYSVNVPVIMASEHGILMALVVNDGEAVKDIGKSLHKVPPYSKENYEISSKMQGPALDRIARNSEAVKSDSEAWNIVWEWLRKQI